jgi:L-lactate dehydrogenase
VDPRNVHAYIIGEHGDTELAIWSHANIGGMVLAEYCPVCDGHCDYKKELGTIFEQVRDAGYRIIEVKGATYYAVGLALVRIVEAILRDENSVLPVSTLINDYYGIEDVCLSIPCIVNRNGVEKVLKIELSALEQKQLQHSAETLKGIIKKIKL